LAFDDYKQYLEHAETFKFKRVRPIFAINSIKIVHASRVRPGHYIWIDPPWTVYKDSKPFRVSSSYPDPHKPVHWHTESMWFKSVRPFYTSDLRFLSITYRTHYGTRFRLSNGWQINAFDSFGDDVEEDDWYVDWYASTT